MLSGRLNNKKFVKLKHLEIKENIIIDIMEKIENKKLNDVFNIT